MGVWITTKKRRYGFEYSVGQTPVAWGAWCKEGDVWLIDVLMPAPADVKQTIGCLVRVGRVPIRDVMKLIHEKLSPEVPVTSEDQM